MSAATYEEVEADREATGQAITVVLLASVATGVGLLDPGSPSLQIVIAGTIAGIAAWVSWAVLTFLIGTRLLAEPETRADVGELLRTIAFASAPGLLRVFGVIPLLRVPVYVVTAMCMLFAMIVAVRQALDYRTTGRAVGVCLVGWALSLTIAAVIGILLAPSVS